jgi:hypothetical protein
MTRIRCDDQPALIAEGLRRRSGLPWHYVHAKAWITEKTECAKAGQGDGSHRRAGILHTRTHR